MSMPFPAIRRPSEVSWRLRAMTQIHRSPLDGSTQTLRQPGEAWVGTMAWPTLGDDDRRALQAFLARLGGRAGRFWYGPPDGWRRATGTGILRTNWLTNSEWGGAGVGVTPAPWVILPSAGCSANVAAVGSDANGSWIDITVTGTPSTSTAFWLRTSAAGTQPSAIGQQWTYAISMQAVGTPTNIANIRHRLYDASAAGVYSAVGVSDTLVPVASLANFGRYSVTRVLADVRAAVHLDVRPSATGSPVALTLRLWAPQLETGPAATAYIPTTSGPVSVVMPPVINGANQAGAVLATRGWTAGAQAMRVGDFLSYTDTLGRRRLHQATADVTADGAGLASIPIAPPIRRAGADGAAVEINAPTGVFRLVNDEVGVSTRPPFLGACTLDIEEALV